MGKSLFWGVVGACLLANGAFAEDTPASPPAPPPESPDKAIPGAKVFTLERFIASGAEQKIAFLLLVEPDCTPMAPGAIRTLVKPQHGSIQTTDAEDYGHWAAANVREKCNDKKIKGLKITYKPDDNYTGDDKASLLYIGSDSSGYQYVFNLHVW